NNTPHGSLVKPLPDLILVTEIADVFQGCGVEATTGTLVVPVGHLQPPLAHARDIGDLLQRVRGTGEASSFRLKHVLLVPLVHRAVDVLAAASHSRAPASRGGIPCRSAFRSCSRCPATTLRR